MNTSVRSRKGKHGIRRGYEARTELKGEWKIDHAPPPGFTYVSAVHALGLAFVEFWSGPGSDVLRLVCPTLGSAIRVELPRATGGTMPFRVFVVDRATWQIQSTPNVVARPRVSTAGKSSATPVQLLVLPFGVLVRRASKDRLSVTLLELPDRSDFPVLSGVKVDFNSSTEPNAQTVEASFRNGIYMSTRLSRKPGQIGIVTPGADITPTTAPSS